MRGQSPASLRLIFDAEHIVTPAIRAKTLDEASRIWRRYGVSLVTEDDGRCAAAADAALTVRIGIGGDPTSGEAGLGEIQFAPDGTPAPAIVLNYDAVARIATSGPVMGLHPALWPSGLREEIIARALGRALAHEIGHYLLRSPHHANAGLMRARQKSSALSSPSDRQFALTEPDRARLQIALAAPTVCPIIAAR